MIGTITGKLISCVVTDASRTIETRVVLRFTYKLGAVRPIPMQETPNRG